MKYQTYAGTITVNYADNSEEDIDFETDDLVRFYESYRDDPEVSSVVIIFSFKR